jgi:hypothetical protein
MAVLAAALVLGSPAGGERGHTIRTRSAAPAEPAAAPAPPPPVDGRRLLDEAWRQPGATLAERAKGTRVASFRVGIWSLDPAARVILRDASLGTPLERAEAAALLAPELPDAEYALARARLSGLDPVGAFDAAVAALRALDRHPEASAWLRATAFDAAARSAILGGILFLAVAGVGVAAALAVPVSLRLGAPSASAGALLAALLLLPAALGEGAVGVALACAAFALARGGLGARAAVLAAALLVLAGLHGIAERRDRALLLMAGDATGAAASSTERDFASPLDLARLERAEAHDELARRALALHARRTGDVAEADRRFRALLDAEHAPADLLNNAANTRFAAGHPDEALALYERAVREEPSPFLLFNLAKAYGRAILLEEQDLALAQAQALDARAVHSLTQHVAEVGAGDPVDIAVSTRALRARAASAPGGPSALARRFAPGRLGASWLGGLAGVGLAALVGLLASLPARRLGAGDDLYAGIARLLQGREATDPSLRMARLAELRARDARLARLRRAAAWAVPGAAGLQAGHAWLGLLAAVLAASAGVAFGARGGLVPDPLAAAESGAFLFGAAALLTALAYAGVLVLSLSLLRRRT